MQMIVRTAPQDNKKDTLARMRQALWMLLDCGASGRWRAGRLASRLRSVLCAPQPG